jgi:hypothetical protein
MNPSTYVIQQEYSLKGLPLFMKGRPLMACQGDQCRGQTEV